MMGCWRLAVRFAGEVPHNPLPDLVAEIPAKTRIETLCGEDGIREGIDVARRRILDSGLLRRRKAEPKVHAELAQEPLDVHLDTLRSGGVHGCGQDRSAHPGVPEGAVPRPGQGKAAPQVPAPLWTGGPHLGRVWHRFGRLEHEGWS